LILGLLSPAFRCHESIPAFAPGLPGSRPFFLKPAFGYLPQVTGDFFISRDDQPHVSDWTLRA
jgi:hypothetical protein